MLAAKKVSTVTTRNPGCYIEVVHNFIYEIWPSIVNIVIIQSRVNDVVKKTIISILKRYDKSLEL